MKIFSDLAKYIELTKLDCTLEMTYSRGILGGRLIIYKWKSSSHTEVDRSFCSEWLTCEGLEKMLKQKLKEDVPF